MTVENNSCIFGALFDAAMGTLDTKGNSPLSRFARRAIKTINKAGYVPEVEPAGPNFDGGGVGEGSRRAAHNTPSPY